MSPKENDSIYAVIVRITSTIEQSNPIKIPHLIRNEFAGFYKNREDAVKHKEILKNKFESVNTIESLMGRIETFCTSSKITTNNYEVIVATFPLKSSFNENYL